LNGGGDVSTVVEIIIVIYTKNEMENGKLKKMDVRTRRKNKNENIFTQIFKKVINYRVHIQTTTTYRYY